MRWADIPYSYLAMTKESAYSDEPQPLEPRPGSRRPLPLRLPDVEEARVVHAAARGAHAGHAGPHRDGPQARRPSRSTPPTLMASTTRSSSCSFDADDPGEFLDLVQELRGTESSAYTLVGDSDLHLHLGIRGARLDALDGEACVRPSLSMSDERHPRHHRHRRRPRRPDHRVLGRHARGQLADHRLAARPRRPAHHALPGEVDLRRAGLPAHHRQGPRGAAREQSLEQFDVPVHLETTADRVEYEPDPDGEKQILRLVTDKGDFLTPHDHHRRRPRRVRAEEAARLRHVAVGGQGRLLPRGREVGVRRQEVVIIVGGGDSACDWVSTCSTPPPRSRSSTGARASARTR